MNLAPKHPHQGFVFDPDEQIVRQQNSPRCKPARRRFLQLAAGGAFVGWLGTAASQLSFPEPALAQSTLTPDAALAELMAGNERLVTPRPSPPTPRILPS